MLVSVYHKVSENNIKFVTKFNIYKPIDEIPKFIINKEYHKELMRAFQIELDVEFYEKYKLFVDNRALWIPFEDLYANDLHVNEFKNKDVLEAIYVASDINLKRSYHFNLFITW